MKMHFNSMIAVAGMSLFSLTQGCIVTLTNDSPREIRVLDLKHNIIFDIKKNKSRRFGSAHEKADIRIYEKQFKNGIFDRTFEVKQIQCANNGNPHIRHSDLENKTGDAKLFAITKNPTPHKPMVRKLPIRTANKN